MAFHLSRRVKLDYRLGQVNPETIPLLKLHGSLNWAARNDDSSIIPLNLGEYFVKYSVPDIFQGSYVTIPIGSQLQEFFNKNRQVEVKAEPVIVPPTWYKGGYHRTLEKVWSEAAKELGEAEYIFIIGYSLPATDLFFRLLYALGTFGNWPFVRIEVFNPDNSTEIRNRYETLLGPGAKARYKYFTLNFMDSITAIRRYF